MLAGVCGVMFGLLIGVLFDDKNLAIQTTPILIIPFAVCGGLAVNLLTMPDIAYWIQYFTPMRYCYAIAMIDQLSTDHFLNLWQY